MSIESLFDELRNNVVSISQRINEMRCSLESETILGKLALGIKEVSRLEGLQEGIEVAMSEIKKNIDTDTNLPASAKRLEGEDINVPTTNVTVVNLPYIHPKNTSATDINVGSKLPKWCKVGAWVMISNQLRKIDHIRDDGKHVFIITDGTDYIYECYKHLIKPVRFRPYSFEEAKGLLLGKTMEYEPTILQARNEAVLVYRVTQYEGDEDVHINSLPFSAWKEMNATIDGVPFGVPVVDEEALKGGAE